MSTRGPVNPGWRLIGAWMLVNVTASVVSIAVLGLLGVPEVLAIIAGVLGGGLIAISVIGPSLRRARDEHDDRR